MIFDKLNPVGLCLITKRFARPTKGLKSWPNDWVPFHWSRPEKVPGYFDTGDLVQLKQPTTEKLQGNYRYSEELKNLPEDHPGRKMFSLDHDKPYEHAKAEARYHLEKLGLVHEVDYSNSLEAKIVGLTFKLRHLQNLIRKQGESSNYTGHLRTSAACAHNRRFRYLNDLKEIHAARFKRLCEELQIEPKENKINVAMVKNHRKPQMRQLAIEYSQSLKEKKVEEFMKTLEDEKKSFEKDKEETERWISEALSSISKVE